MKLKIYRYTLLSCLFACFVLSACFLAISIKNVIGISKEDLMDGIMYILCFVLNLAFIGLEIFNTFYSFKTGSHFAKNLTYNEDNSFNKKFVIIISFLNVFVLVALIYLCIIYKGELELPLSQMKPLAKAVSIAFLSTVFVNITFTILFPILGKEDQSFQISNNH